jgi:type I restriction enzyme S subunit
MPSEWVLSKLEELVSQSFTGLVRSAAEQGIENSYSYLKMNNISTSGKFDLSDLVKVNADEVEVEKYSLKKGDFIFNTRNSVELVGKCGVFKIDTPAPILFNNNLLKIKFLNIKPEIVAHWLNSAIGKDQLKSITSATTSVAAIYQKQLMALDVPVIPLAEQQQIAQKLDELLAQVDTLKTRLDAIPKILKRFRQSVLAAAISGRLTEEWRGINETPIKNNLLEEISEYWATSYKIKNKKFKAPVIPALENPSDELPESWKNTQIGYIFDVHVGATPSRAEESFWGGEVSWVSSSEVAFCRIKSTKEKITEEGLKSASTTVHPKGTVMLAMIGQGKTRGQVGILDIEACHNQNTAALRIPENYANSMYLYFYLTKQYEETRRVGSGNNQQALNKATVQGLPFPLPTLEEQTEIVRRVEQLFVYADQIEQRVKDAQARVNHLTQSILAKAFRGELTADWRAQNPELISGENSAAALLERIKAERETTAKPKKKVAIRKS